MSFDNDPRRRQELAGRPIADNIYQSIFGQDVGITRMDRTENLILDIKFAIDARLTLTNGQILLGQEKFLSNKYASFKSVTIEFWQNPVTQEPVDWFKIAVQYYFVGYFNQTDNGFDPWIILNWPSVVLATKDGKIKWNDNRNKDGRARASFRWCSMAAFPMDCVIARSF